MRTDTFFDLARIERFDIACETPPCTLQPIGIVALESCNKRLLEKTSSNVLHCLKFRDLSFPHGWMDGQTDNSPSFPYVIDCRYSLFYLCILCRSTFLDVMEKLSMTDWLTDCVCVGRTWDFCDVCVSSFLCVILIEFIVLPGMCLLVRRTSRCGVGFPCTL